MRIISGTILVHLRWHITCWCSPHKLSNASCSLLVAPWRVGQMKMPPPFGTCEVWTLSCTIPLASMSRSVRRETRTFWRHQQDQSPDLHGPTWPQGCHGRVHHPYGRSAQYAILCRYQSWTYCPKCQKLETRKLQPAFRRKTPSPLHNVFKCGNSIYIVPNIEDVPLILCNRTEAEVRVLCSLEIHCGEYKCHFNSYRQQTGPFRVSWSKQIITERIDILDDPACRHTLLQVYQFLMQKEDSSYSKFVHMHNNGYHRPFFMKSSPLAISMT